MTSSAKQAAMAIDACTSIQLFVSLFGLLQNGPERGAKIRHKKVRQQYFLVLFASSKLP